MHCFCHGSCTAGPTYVVGLPKLYLAQSIVLRSNRLLSVMDGRQAVDYGQIGDEAMKRRLLVTTLMVAAGLVGSMHSTASFAMGQGSQGREFFDAGIGVCPPTCIGFTGWVYADSPNPDSQDNFKGVSVVGPNNVWAVGGAGDGQGDDRNLIEHWNGSQWHTVASPHPGDGSGTLLGVDALDASDVWAVGYHGYQLNGNANNHTEAMHWNGFSWSVATTPQPAHDSRLVAVSALAYNDVWAVGNSTHRVDPNVGIRTLVVHWDGSSWTRSGATDTIDVPGAYRTYITGVIAISANNVWAVGYYSLSQNGHTHAVAWRWNGQHWNRVAFPDFAPAIDSAFYSVSAVGPGSIWAVGEYEDSPVKPLIANWNGSGWTQYTAPDAGFTYRLNSVSVASANDVWAVGGDLWEEDGQNAVILHWNGIWWTQQSAPNAAEYRTLEAVSTGGSGNPWAVGYSCEWWLSPCGMHKTVAIEYLTP